MTIQDFQPTPERLSKLEEKMAAYDSSSEQQIDRRSYFELAIQQIMEEEEQKVAAKPSDPVDILYNSLFSKKENSPSPLPPKEQIKEENNNNPIFQSPTSFKKEKYEIILINRFLHALTGLSSIQRKYITFFVSVNKEFFNNKKELLYSFNIKAEQFIFSCQENINERNVERTYQELSEITESLLQRYFHHKECLLEDRPVTVSTSWIVSACFSKQDHSIVITISHEVAQLLDTFNNYSFFNNDHKNILFDLTGHSVLLFELVIRNLIQGHTRVKMSIDYLREFFDCTHSYSNVSDFKAYVIDKSISEISQKTSLSITYTQERTSRVVTDLLFTFQDRNATTQHPNQNTSIGVLKTPEVGFSMTEDDLYLYSQKIAAALDKTAQQVRLELLDPLQQKQHIPFLKLLGYKF
ncbi:replication initiation protein [Moraxella nasovis]|uniref:replication initiation protein n=1 Tax=Moraxella nasovis TaxID=2904121 RepID=UPI001F612937|nr:replication initiation protein [Moraxella nasovis]UNU73386.1 replication initiation protein [Moraxella nasovis]